MNRRSFIKGAASIIGLSAINPSILVDMLRGYAYRDAKRKCLEAHSIEMERALLFGARESWRDKILGLYPAGDSPLIGLIRSGKTSPHEDPKFSWWTEKLKPYALK